jgi:hypothetical protein
MPKPEKTAATMEKYWNFYKVENYDSLKTFYIPKGNNPDEKYKDLCKALHGLHENYGNVHNVLLTGQSATKSLGEGETIGLTYEVEFEKKVINHEFSFKKDDKGEFRIMDHTFSQ